MALREARPAGHARRWDWEGRNWGAGACRCKGAAPAAPTPPATTPRPLSCSHCLAAGRDLPPGAVKSLSADERLASLPQYRGLAAKVPQEQRHECRRVLVSYLPISSGQWRWVRPGDLEAFDGNAGGWGRGVSLRGCQAWLQSTDAA